MIIWLCGLSGAGKTAIGREVYSRWKRLAPDTALIDGDEFREILDLHSNAQDYTPQSRRSVTKQIAAIAGWLDRQDINVVVCNISIGPDQLEENRSRFERYFEVFIDVPVEVLIERDNKGLYLQALEGEMSNVVGIDIDYPGPNRPDFVIDNRGYDVAPADWAERILDRAGIDLATDGEAG